MSTRIKFCGITSWSDVELAIAAGADAVGLIFAPSPRRIDLRNARDIASRIGAAITPVGVFVNPAPGDVERVRDLFPAMLLQFSGDETPEAVASFSGATIKTIHIANEGPEELETLANRYSPALPLFEKKSAAAYGGTGMRFDWGLVRAFAGRRPIFIAGGLTPENVGELVASVRPYGVDVRSGIETSGRKDLAKMRAFVRRVRENDAA